ncbi:Uncharacterised protein [Vibrio cholerae]|nr:Uncharacterised protein [Vibrio cholerae]
MRVCVPFCFPSVHARFQSHRPSPLAINHQGFPLAAQDRPKLKP